MDVSSTSAAAGTQSNTQTNTQHTQIQDTGDVVTDPSLISGQVGVNFCVNFRDFCVNLSVRFNVNMFVSISVGPNKALTLTRPTSWSLYFDPT